MARCVRRAFLCGFDRLSNRDFEHRRQWVIDRIAVLADVFAVDVVAYAIMSNHYHLVLRIDAERAAAWSSEEVIERWSKLFGIPSIVEMAANAKAPAAVFNAARQAIETRRDRLSDLSWFMKCLNEFIARKANAEDGCTGSFWEGRFKSQALLDERALLSCMVYVDLNPIRAAIARTPEESEFTSIRQRLVGDEGTGIPLVPLTDDSNTDAEVPIALKEYAELVDWTGRAVTKGKRGAIASDLPPILDRLKHTNDSWAASMKLFQNAEIKVLGPVLAIREFAQRVSRQWFRGMADCKRALEPG
ncbi:MAG: hypothetical protein AAGA95_07190 [Pseudomonadota bacterium]